MFNFPEISEVRFPKLIIHSIFLMIILTFLSLFSADIVGWTLGRPVEASEGLVTLIVIIWILFALQSNKYKKQSL